MRPHKTVGPRFIAGATSTEDDLHFITFTLGGSQCPYDDINSDGRVQKCVFEVVRRNG